MTINTKVNTFSIILLAIVSMLFYANASQAGGGQNRWASEEIDYVYQLCKYTDADEVLIEQEVGGTNTVIKVDCSDGAGDVNGEIEDDEDSS